MNAKKYFTDNDFESSDLINLLLNKRKKELFLALRYAMTLELIDYLHGNGKPKNPINDFRLLIFNEVENFKSKIIELKEDENEISFCLEKDRGVFTIEDIELNILDTKPTFHILIPLILPTEIEFTFASLSTKQKFGRGVKRQNENDWDYFDVETGEQFDFYNPFSISVC